VIYSLLFTVGFAFDKRIFSQSFWRVTAIPYIYLSIVTVFLCSPAFKHDVLFDVIYTHWSSGIEQILGSTAIVIMLYKYAFTDKIWTSTNTKEEN